MKIIGEIDSELNVGGRRRYGGALMMMPWFRNNADDAVDPGAIFRVFCSGRPGLRR